MATKKQNKRYIVRRHRYALNHAEVPPTSTSNKILRCSWGKGPSVLDIDAADGSNDPDTFFYLWDEDYDRCVYCDSYSNCLDVTEGPGWSFSPANTNLPLKCENPMCA